MKTDDLWHPTMLERCFKRFHHNPNVSVVTTDWVHIDAEGRALPTPSGFRPACGVPLEALAYDNPFLMQGAVFRARCFEKRVAR